jgi:hypothetical protein
MLGLDILGALSAGVQLAGLCLDAARRLCAYPSDKKLGDFIQTECYKMTEEIDDRILDLSVNDRLAAQAMRQCLVEIGERIERRKQHKWLLKWSEKLRLCGQENKEAMLLALQQYQTRATMSGVATIEEIKNRVGELPKDMSYLLDPIVQDLVNSLIQSLLIVQERLQNAQVEMRSDIRVTCAAVKRIEGRIAGDQVQTFRAVSGDLNYIKKELDIIRSTLAFSMHTTLSRNMDRPDLRCISGNDLVSYFGSVYSSGGCPTEQELWELAWDLSEAIKACDKLPNDLYSEIS